MKKFLFLLLLTPLFNSCLLTTALIASLTEAYYESYQYSTDTGTVYVNFKLDNLPQFFEDVSPFFLPPEFHYKLGTQIKNEPYTYKTDTIPLEIDMHNFKHNTPYKNILFIPNSDNPSKQHIDLFVYQDKQFSVKSFKVDINTKAVSDMNERKNLLKELTENSQAYYTAFDYYATKNIRKIKTIPYKVPYVS